MNANVYLIDICDNAMDLVHHFTREITELYIPNKKIAFNEDDGSYHCFTTNKDRYAKAIKIGEIEVPKAMIQAMSEYINISKRLGKTKKWFKRCIIKGIYKSVPLMQPIHIEPTSITSTNDIEERKPIKKAKRRVK